MSKKKPWNETPIVDGYTELTFLNWRTFIDFINHEFLELNKYIFRGQSKAKWPLESSLDRLLRKIGKLNDPLVRIHHLNSFVLATRGRRGPHPHKMADDNEIWALGQHHGLATPLLDWTESPFAALYFAFENDVSLKVKYKSIFALYVTSIDVNMHKVRSKPNAPEIVEIIRPNSDENARLTSQRGLFTLLPYKTTLESWIKVQFKDDNTNAHLVKFLIPNNDRENCLKSLNRMNINRLSLFPDIEGAASYCNTKLLINHY